MTKTNVISIIIIILICGFLIFTGFIISKLIPLYGELKYERDVSPTPIASQSSVMQNTSEVKVDDSATPSPTPLLFKNGSQGEEVKKIQEALKALGFYNSEIDGQFGNGTKNSIIWFQKQHGLDSDGIVGPTTYELLFSSSAQKAIATPSPSPTPSTPVAADVDYLILVNKDNPLKSDYAPSNLINLSEVANLDIIKIKYKNTKAEKKSFEALVEMIQAANKDGLKTWQVSSAYRSIKDQQTLFDRKKQEFIKDGYSEKRAISATNISVALPGTSEHHTGLAFDLTVPRQFFKDTQQSLWVSANCWKYGFILRYEKDKESITGVIAEPWHIRYVGLPHSTIMRDEALCLEEYLTSDIYLQSNQG